MRKKRIVVVGGGHGLSVILKGLKNILNIDITAIVTVADDGGSTGRLRKQYAVPAMGDIRNVLIALSKSETLLAQLMDYRFEGVDEEDVGGHNLGNLIITAMTETTGNFMEAISELSKVLNVAGTITPSTSEIVTLYARMSDGTIVKGESNIPNYYNHIEEVFYDRDIKATSLAINAIKKADIIVFGIGSLYTSILPNIIIKEIKQAINKSKATKIYLCNTMSQHGETDGYSVSDHVLAIEKHLESEMDVVVCANDTLPSNILLRYEEEQAYPIAKDELKRGVLIERELLDFSSLQIKHSPEKLEQLFIELLKEYGKK